MNSKILVAGAVIIFSLLAAGHVASADTIIQQVGSGTNAIFYAYGDNEYGQLGTGNTDSVPEAKKVNLAQIAMYPNSPTYDAAGRFVKVVQIDGAIVALDTYGAIWTAGNNDEGQLGRGLATTADSSTFSKVSGKYTFSDFKVVNGDTVVATKLCSTTEFMTWGSDVPNLDYTPSKTSTFVGSIPLGAKSTYPEYYKTNTVGNIIEAQRFAGYNNFTSTKKIALQTSQTNSDVTIGQNNNVTIQTYSGSKSTADSMTQYFYSSNSTVTSSKKGRANLILANTTYDANGKKKTQTVQYLAKDVFLLKYFEPKFQTGNNAEQSEYIVDYTAGDGSRKEYLKTYDKNGLIYNYSPDWTADRGAKGGIWVSMTETDYNAAGQKILYADNKYNQDTNNRRNYQNIKWYDPTTGNATKLAAQWFYDKGDLNSMGEVVNPVQQKYQATVYVDGKATQSQLQYYNENGGQTMTVSAEYETSGAYAGNAVGYFYKYLDGSLEAKDDQSNHLTKTINLKFDASSAVSYSYDPSKLYDQATYQKITNY